MKNTQLTLKLLLLLSIFGLLVNETLCQRNANIDSLYSLLISQPETSNEHIKTLVNISHAYIYEKQPDSSIQYINKALLLDSVYQLLEDGYLQHFIVKAWTCQGGLQYTCSRDYLQKALAIARKFKGDKINELELNLGAVLVQSRDSSALSYSKYLISEIDTSVGEYQDRWILGHIYLSRSHENLYNFERAIEILISLLEDPILNRKPQFREGIFNSLGILFKQIENNEAAMRYTKIANNLSSKKDINWSLFKLNLAKLFLDQNQLDSARLYLKMVNNNADFDDFECQIYHDILTKIALKENKIQDALHYNILCAKCMNENTDPYIIAQNLSQKATILLKLNKIRSAENELKNAKSFLQNGNSISDLELNEAIDQINLKIEITKNAPNNITSLYSYLESSKKLNDTRNKKALKELSFKYESEKKEQEILLLSSQNELIAEKFQKQKSYLLASLIALAGLIFGLFFYRRQKVQQKQFYDDEIQSLKILNERWKTKLDNAKEANNNLILNENDKLNLKGMKEGVSFLDIAFIMSRKNDVQLHFKDKPPSAFFRIPLKTIYDTLLPKSVFIQVHKSFIVNKKLIHKIEKNTILTTTNNLEKAITIGRTYISKVKKL